MDNIIVAVTLISLTLADGAIFSINPQYVVRVYPTKEAVEGGVNQLMVKGARCVITMTDGKFNAVREPCEVVKLKLEGKMK